MPTISTKFGAHLVDQTSARATWAEVDFTGSGASVLLTRIDSAIQKTITSNVGLSAYLVPTGTSVGSITTSLDTFIRGAAGSRDLSSALAVALSQEQLEVFFAIDLSFDSGDVNLWTGIGQTTINGTTYTGTGQLLNISSVEEGKDIKARGATLLLSGVPSTLLSLALNEPYQGRTCTISFGVVSNTTEMTELFTGYMDQMNVTESGETCTIELVVENRLVDLEKPRVARFTSAYQKSLYPDDLGLDYIESLQDKRLVWGRS